MTLTWDELTIAWDNVDYDWEGGFLAPSTAPYQFYTASNLLVSLAKTGTLTNSFAASGSLLAYTATGVIED